MAQRLDSYGKYPSGMQEYLEMYGWHCSKKMVEWCVSKMKRKNPQTGKEEPIEKMTKEQIEEFLKKYGVSIDNAEGYDLVYVFQSAKSDYYKSSLSDEAHLALHVKDYFGDIDAYPERTMTHIYADAIAKGSPIIWEDML